MDLKELLVVFFLLFASVAVAGESEKYTDQTVWEAYDGFNRVLHGYFRPIYIHAGQ